MYRYCVDFESHSADWIGYAANSQELADGVTNCSRAWVVLQSGDFAALASAAGGAGASGPFTASEVELIKYQLAHPSPFQLSASEGGLIVSLVLGVWALAWGFRALMSIFGPSSTESDRND